MLRSPVPGSEAGSESLGLELWSLGRPWLHPRPRRPPRFASGEGADADGDGARDYAEAFWKIVVPVTVPPSVRLTSCRVSDSGGTSV